jgi:hypothetical protein
MKFLISFGANRWRCEYCRHNFVDFRPRLEKFSFNRWRERGRGREDGGDPGGPDRQERND